MSSDNEREFINHLQNKEKGGKAMVSAKEKYRRGIEGGKTERGKAMKCPLLHLGWVARRRVEVPEVSDYLKGECAWWNSELEACSIVALVIDIGSLAEILATLKDKMPDSLPFER